MVASRGRPCDYKLVAAQGQEPCAASPWAVAQAFFEAGGLPHAGFSRARAAGSAIFLAASESHARTLQSKGWVEVPGKGRWRLLPMLPQAEWDARRALNSRFGAAIRAARDAGGRVRYEKGCTEVYKVVGVGAGGKEQLELLGRLQAGELHALPRRSSQR